MAQVFEQKEASASELDAVVSAELEALTLGVEDSDVDDELVFEVMAQRCPPGSPLGDPITL